MGGCGTGKSGIEPREEASEAKEEVVSGREDRCVDGENISSVVKVWRYFGGGG